MAALSGEFPFQAMRSGHNRGVRRSEVPPQPTPPKFETKSSSRNLNEDSDSRRGTPTKAVPSTQQGRGSYRSDRARGYPNNRGGGGRGRASGRGSGDTYACRLKERYGTHYR